MWIFASFMCAWNARARSSNTNGYLIRLACILLATVAGLAQATPATSINEEAKLFDPLPPTIGAQSGTSVSISGDTAVIGAPNYNGNLGAAYVYVRDSGTGVWSWQQTLSASDGAAGDLFGASVSVSGNNIAVGAAGRNSNTGAVYTFNRSGTVWTQGVVLTATGGASGDKLGWSVSIQGLTLIAGAPYSSVGNKAHVGSAYVFTSLNSGVTWQQQYHIAVSTGQAKPEDHLGWSVALSGNTALIGAPDDDFGSKTDAGSVYVFVRNGSRWKSQARINPGATAGNRVGASVALNGNTAVFGVDGANSATGFVYVYSRSGTSWTLVTTLTASDGAAGDHFGAAVGISGPRVVVGAPQPSSGGGKAYYYETVTPGVYQEVSFLSASDNFNGDHFGASAALDSGRAIVGAPSATTGVQTHNGAGYVFKLAQSSLTNIVSIAPEPTITGQSYSVHVQVASDPVGSGPPTGTVAVGDGDGATCTITLDVSGQGNCSLASSSAGSHTIGADFSGDLIFGASTTTATHMVNFADTTTSVAQDVSPSVVGQVVTATVNVAPVAPGAGTPTGAVTVTDGSVSCNIPDISLGNTCTLTFTTPGTTNLVASYAGDPGFNASDNSATALSHITNKADTKTTITADNPDPSLPSQTVTVSVAVTVQSPGAATVTGSVTITDDADPLVTCTIVDITLSQSCDLTTFSLIGTSNLTASYSGNAQLNVSASAGESHTVNAPPTNHLTFGTQPGDLFSGGELNGITVEIRQDITNVLQSGDNTSTVTLSLTACGGPVTFGPMPVVNGVATFTGLAPRFYTVVGNLQLIANSNPANTPATSNPFNINLNTDLVFSDGYDSCRL